MKPIFVKILKQDGNKITLTTEEFQRALDTAYSEGRSEGSWWQYTPVLTNTPITNTPNPQITWTSNTTSDYTIKCKETTDEKTNN